MPSLAAASWLSLVGCSSVFSVAPSPVNAISAVAPFLVADAINAFTSSRLTPASAAKPAETSASAAKLVETSASAAKPAESQPAAAAERAAGGDSERTAIEIERARSPHVDDAA